MSVRSQREGTVYRRKDGRWEGAAYLGTVNGKVRRLRVYGKTSKEASDKLTIRLADAQRGIPIPEKSWTVNAYLDYFMREIAPTTLRPSTVDLYENTIRNHIKPLLKSQSLAHLSVGALQNLINQQSSEGKSPALIRTIRTVLGAALTRAMREDLIVRNVAQLVVLPTYKRKRIIPWTAEEVARFLNVAKTSPLYPAFLMISLFGLRKGEVLGLRSSNIDWDNGQIHIRQQLQMVSTGLRIGPVKTEKGERDLPLLRPVREAIQKYQAIQESTSIQPADDYDLIFRSKHGLPIAPGNFSYAFHQIRQQAGLRYTRVHDMRHAVATLLKNNGVPDRDIQLILGHSRITTTQELYEHGDVTVQNRGLDRLERAVMNASESGLSRQSQPSSLYLTADNAFLTAGGLADFGANPNIMLYTLTRLRRDPYTASVLKQLRARTNTYILGGLAVNLAVKPDDLNCVVWDWIPLREALTPAPLLFIRSDL